MRHFILYLLVCLPFMAHSQYADTIRTGRPGIAFGPFTVGAKILQIQSGVTSTKEEWGVTDNNTTSFQSIAIVRYGIAENVEISGVIAHTTSTTNLENETLKKNGINAAQIGFRVNLRDGKGSGPNIGFQTRLKLNLLGEDFEQKELANVSVIAISQRLSPKVGLLTNFGVSWSGNDPAPAGLYAVNLNMPLSNRISIFLENYGGVQNHDFDTRFDTGLGYLVNPNFQLDFSFGYGNNDDVEDYFFDVGFSWRTSRAAN